MARGVNKVILIGNLGKDPEVRYMPSGGAVANVTIATSESWKDKTTGEQQERTEWHNVVFYNRETLEVHYKHKNIREILEMTVEDARAFFDPVPAIAHKLQMLMEVGLGYIKLGQNATTLSGGEAQRVKLARELSRRDTGNTMYILDEPTTGLHFHDIEQLLRVLHHLRDHGNTVVVIEHNLDVIKTADWIIDLGPEGGGKGGQVIATGTPEHVSAQAHSYTGQYLKPVLERV